MADCKVIAKSIGWCEGKPEYSGAQRRVYYQHKSNIVGWPEYERETNGRPKSAELKGKFTLAEGEVWHYIDFDPAQLQFTSEPQGELPSQLQLNKLNGVHPGIGPEAAAAAAYINNSDIVALVQDMSDRYRVVGSKRWSTKATVNQDSGQGYSAKVSTTINLEAPDEMPLPFYSGPIETEEGTINEATTA